MANHFHLLCEVPEPQTLSEAEILERVQAGCGPARRQALQEEIARYRQQPDGEAQIQRASSIAIANASRLMVEKRLTLFFRSNIN